MLYNERKQQVLEVFACSGDFRPRHLAVKVKFYPTRSMYTYLLRLYRGDTCFARRDFGGRDLYSLSPKGAHTICQCKGHTGCEGEEAILKREDVIDYDQPSWECGHRES